MSQDYQKADQIAFHFYTKLFYVVNQARATAEPRTQSKVDKWFNLETPDSDLFTKEAREPYKSISQGPCPPPLEIQVVLAIPDLAHNQVLVHLTPESSRVRIEPTPKAIVLETWTLSFAPRRADEDTSIDVALPTIYKHGIPLFRSLYTLLRVLPTWKLYKRLKRRSPHNLSISLRVKGEGPNNSILDFDVPPSPSVSVPLATQIHNFSPVPHPLGTLTLSARYLELPTFQLEELESVLSSRFISQDLGGGDGFVPTLVNKKQSQQQPKSSTSDESVSIAERFILPVARTPSNPSSSVRNIPQPPRQLASGEYAGGVLASQSPSGLAISRFANLKEGFGSSSPSSSLSAAGFAATSGSVSSSPSSGPLPIRRPSINPVHPFKTNTVSSASGSSPSLSIRQSGLAGSPLSTGGHSRTTSVSSRHPPPSPIGAGLAAPTRSPPGAFAPSSLEVGRRPGTSGSTGSGGSSEYQDKRLSLGAPPVGGSPDDLGRAAQGLPPRKRYSSSFGHRYANSVGSGEGGSVSGRSTPAIPPSVGASGLGIEGISLPRERKDSNAGAPSTGLSSLMSTTTDDDDISVFVQDIDQRKPLSGRDKEREKRILDRIQRRGLTEDDGPRPGQGHDRFISEASDTSTVKPLRGYGEPAGSSFSGRTSMSPPPSAPSSRFSTTSTATVPIPGSSSSSSKDHSAAMSVSPPNLSLSPTRGPMLTSQSEVEERLRKMNETFLKSLEGFGLSNAAKRKEREQKKRDKELKEKERERAASTSSASSVPRRSSSATDPVSAGADTPSGSSSNTSGTITQGNTSSTADTDTQLAMYAGRGLSIRPPRERDRPLDSFGAPTTPLNYASLGMGVRRRTSDEDDGTLSALAGESNSDLGHSVNVSQGSEEVIGKMEIYGHRGRDRDTDEARLGLGRRGYHRYNG